MEDEEGPLASASAAHEVVELQYVSTCSPGRSGGQGWEGRAVLDRCSLLQPLDRCSLLQALDRCSLLQSLDWCSLLQSLDWCSLLQSFVFRPWLGCGPPSMLKVRIAPGLPWAPDSGVGGQYFHPICHLGMSLATWRCRWHWAPSYVLMVDTPRGHEVGAGRALCGSRPFCSLSRNL